MVELINFCLFTKMLSKCVVSRDAGTIKGQGEGHVVFNGHFY